MKPPPSGDWLSQKGNCFYIDAACATTKTCVGTGGTSGGITSDQIKNYIISHQDKFQAYYGGVAGTTTGADPEQQEMNNVWRILNKLRGWGN